LIDQRTQTLAMPVAVFATRKDALAAMKQVGLKDCTPVPLDEAIDRFLRFAS
jgi:hypothetical protein